MNSNRIKKALAGVVLLSGLLFGAGGVLGTTAMAQDRCYRGGYVYTYPRTYPYGGYYGGYPGGYYGGYGNGSFSYWQQRGYRDGLNRGREDAHSGRYPTPNNSQHFRDGNAAYRQGFARGYQIGFQQYGGYYGRY
jgi:hypothetical protein